MRLTVAEHQFSKVLVGSKEKRVFPACDYQNF